MRPYEIMVILDAGLEEDAIRVNLDRATQLLTSNGATVNKVDRWGKRRFAYEVHHRSEGYYVLIETVAEPAAVAAVDRMLGLADDVIRHKVIRLPDKALAKASKHSEAAAPAAPAAPAAASVGAVNAVAEPAEANENGAK